MAGTNQHFTARHVAELPALEDEARDAIAHVLGLGHTRVAMGYSGGKDGIVALHLARAMDPKAFHAVCEVSWCFARAVADIKASALDAGLYVSYRDSLGIDWLRAHSDIIFSENTARRSWSFSVRQQRTVKRFAKEQGCTAQMFGRRTEENSVKALVYETKVGTQLHPVRNWREGHIWAYMDKHRIPTPWIYSTRFGRYEGNAPFYALKPSVCGSVDECWELVSQLDPRYTKRNLIDE
jgi:3'-phosphoadenosine 5'-phosphosulfate sulfotransferase (PAPS reductase)/FAD synthetase